jgi:hypothetical protein
MLPFEMRFFVVLIATAFLAGCACEHEAAVHPQAAPRVQQTLSAIQQLAPAEKEALHRADTEIAATCARNRAEADIPRGQFAAYDECATALYDRYLQPVTAYRDEFRNYRARGREAARQYDRGDLSYAQLQERRRNAWFGYLAERQTRGLSSYERFRMDDADMRARYESIVQGTPGLVSPQCDYRYGC